ncbi:hypothetical protein BD626DRAFT_548877 [Schizophyllum amplum]|uniref:Uncharacterized protein n=1 Tax=Schizophyllum amplum TaxID=97359 RepID=A0A550CA73_9AGAR|nr:hypothetical protein BD626DRAFT_548877 [Auriculariopsis ampla]
MAPAQAIINTTYGALVTGIWMQQLLLGYILAQMIDYYRRYYKTDGGFNKFVVTSLLVLNIFVGGTDFHVLYRCTVLHYGDYEFFDLQDWTMSTEPGWTAVIGLISQLFFLNRCQNIVRSKIVTGVFSCVSGSGYYSCLRLIANVLMPVVLFSLGSGLAVSGSFIVNKRFSLLGKFTTPIILWLTSTASADIAIAVVLHGIITRLVTLSMETSTTTALVALLNLVLYLPLQDTAYHLLPQFSMCRVYTITVLATLLGRDKQRRILESAEHASFPTAIRVGVTTTTQCDFGGSNKDPEYELSSKRVRDDDAGRKSVWNASLDGNSA